MSRPKMKIISALFALALFASMSSSTLAADTIYIPAGATFDASIGKGKNVLVAAVVGQPSILVEFNKPIKLNNDLYKCSVQMEAKADLSSERVFLRGESVACRSGENEILIQKTSSVVGSDKMMGVKGEFVLKMKEPPSILLNSNTPIQLVFMN